MSGRIVVCLTCNRYAAPRAGEPTPGRRLAAALLALARQAAGAITVRTVECLNGCPHPCTAALRLPGKCLIRFSGLTVDDAPALIDAAQHYAASADGNIPTELLPQGLRDKVSLRVAAMHPS